MADVLFRLTNAESCAVAHPATRGAKLCVQRQNDVGCSHFVDYQRLAEVFRQGYVVLEDDALTLDVSSAQAVDAAFADGNDLRMTCGGFEQTKFVVADDRCTPRMDAYRIVQSRSGVESVGLNADYADMRIRLMGMCVDEHYGTGS